MKHEKIIKDNVHGYIHISKDLFAIIDSALFQRLKNIKQTSYVSLYPSSTHDRFTHSLGTYYLGKQLIDSLWENLEEDVGGIIKSNCDIKEITFTFEIACLLHDVGHAPFSHTGENFYKVKRIDPTLKFFKEYEKYIEKYRIANFCYLDGMLLDELYKQYPEEKIESFSEIKTFMSDYNDVLRDDLAKPHEKMSALLGLRNFISMIKEIAEKRGTSFNADLFVRCITGTQYKKIYRNEADNYRYTFYNAIISLLNSDIIDVDKLDYILRDNYMTGFQNTSIDTERLIKSFNVVIKDNDCVLVYKKNALSVIENVVRANDSSRRWVQNHPIILYDTYITQKSVCETFKVFKEGKNDSSVFEKFFSAESLTLEGNEWAKDEYVFLSSDLDVISLIKRAYHDSSNEFQKSIFEEYFCRDKRRHPLWKSEAEFQICFRLVKGMRRKQKEIEIYNKIIDAVVALDTYKDNSTGVGKYIFTDQTYETEKGNLKSVARIFIDAIREYFRKIKKPMDIAILTTRSFSSKMKKLNANSLQVEMPDYNFREEQKIYSYSDLFQIDDTSTDKMIFYIYSHHEIDIKDFLSYLFDEADFEEKE